MSFRRCLLPIAIALAAPALRAQCPEGAEEVGRRIIGSQLHVDCRCRAGRVNVRGRCLPIDEEGSARAVKLLLAIRGELDDQVDAAARAEAKATREAELAEQRRNGSLAREQAAEAAQAEREAAAARQVAANNRRWREEDRERIAAIDQFVDKRFDGSLAAFPLRVSGKVSIETADGLVPLSPNRPLRRGDKIVVGPGGRVEFRLVDSTRLILESTCVFTFEEQPPVESGKPNLYRLIKGKLRWLRDCHKYGGDFCRDRSQINVGTFAIWVRGTEFVLDADGPHISLVVRSGELSVASPAAGASVVVRAGQRLALTAGSEPGQPAPAGDGD